MKLNRLVLVVWLLACGDARQAEPEHVLACEDVERTLLARVRSAIGAEQLSETPAEQLTLSVLDDPDARYVAVEVRAPNGMLLVTYRIERATGALSQGD